MSIRRQVLPILALAAVGALLQGCMRPGTQGPRLFASDFQGAAKTCVVPTVAPAAGKTVEATIQVGSDAGWCGLKVNNGGAPYATELLTARPAHGKVYVHQVGNDTRIDYTPDTGYVGPDSFTLQLLPGDAIVHATVTDVAH